MAHVIDRLRRENTALKLEVFRVRRSREEWKRKAVARSEEIRNLRRQVERWKARAPEWRKPPRRKPTYTEAQWAEHARIVERIERIPNRPIY